LLALVMATCQDPVVPCEAIPLDPLSDDYGFDRGTPLDRWYIERFLAQHREAIRGSVLEVGDPKYCAQFGEGHISKATIVDVDSSNPQATLIADLAEPGSLPADAYDCIILTEVLHLVASPDVCIQNCGTALRGGGSLLVTVPALKRVSPSHPRSDFWRFTPPGLALLLHRHWQGPVSVTSFGNLRVCVGFLLAHVVEDFGEDDLAPNDARFPVTVAANAQKQ
jgi:SAM-dependent methyltransferase